MAESWGIYSVHNFSKPTNSPVALDQLLSTPATSDMGEPATTRAAAMDSDGSSRSRKAAVRAALLVWQRGLTISDTQSAGSGRNNHMLPLHLLTRVQPTEELLQVFFIPFRYHFHTPISPVAHPPGQTQLQTFVLQHVEMMARLLPRVVQRSV